MMDAIFKNHKLSFITGSLVLFVVAAVSIVVIYQYLPEQNLAPTPFLSETKSSRPTFVVDKPCVVGAKCDGPEIKAVDPENDNVIYHFYDKATGQEITKQITAESGKTVVPKFQFNESGEKQLYVVVEDGAGHESAEYPIIMQVK